MILLCNYYLRTLILKDRKMRLSDIQIFFSPTRAISMFLGARISALRGTAFTTDSHSIRYSFSTPFFPRR